MTTDREYSEAMERVRLRGLAESVSQSEGTATFLTYFVYTLLVVGLLWLGSKGLDAIGFAFGGWVR